jgi:RHS repeat-associated protein
MRLRRHQLEALGRVSLTNQRRGQLFALRGQGFSVEEQDTDLFLLRDAAGHTAELFDEGDACTVVSGEGRRFRLENDHSGNLSAIEDPVGLRVQFHHDAEGRLVSVRRGEHSNFSYSYQDGHLSRAEEPDGTVATYRHDERGRLAEIIDRNGNSRTLKYDAEGRLVGTVAPTGAETRFAYDGFEVPSTIELPGGDRYEFAYTAEGRLESFALNGVSHARYKYDEPSGTREVHYSDGSWARFRFEGDRLVEAANENGVVRLDYDGTGHLLSEEFDGQAVQYSRDATGALTGVSLAGDDEIVSFERDGEGRLSAITDWHGGRYVVQYHDVGAPSEIQYPNGVVQSMTASRMGLVEHLAVRRIASAGDPLEYCRWEYDVCDRLVFEDRNGQQSRFDYDGEGRLTGVNTSRPERSCRLELDADGNRLRDGTGEYRYDGDNRLVSVPGGTCAYDALGNLVRGTCPKGPARFSYNGRGQLVAVDLGPGPVIRYEYDALGRRVGKQIGTRVTRFVWAGTQLVREITRNGERVDQRDFLYAGEHPVPIGMRVGMDTFHLHPGRRGEPLCMTDRAGRVVWQAEYDAFGSAKPLIREVDQPFRLLGQYFDEETGLHYNLARYHDPRFGRFLTQDPLRVSGGSLNFYLYAAGDPLNKCDPTGELIPLLVGVGILAAIAIGAAVNGYREYKRQKEEYGEVKKPLDVVEEAGIGGAAGLVGAVVAIGAAKVLAAGAVVAVIGKATALQTAFLAGAVSGLAAYCTDAGLSSKREATVEGAGWAAGLGGALGGAFQLLARPVSGLVGRIFGRSAPPKTQPPKVTESMGSEALDDAIRFPAKPGGRVVKEVEIVDKRGAPLGEFDEIDLSKSCFVEDKSAKGLARPHPKTGKPVQTPEDWAAKQVGKKTRVRIENLKKADATRATKGGSTDVPSLDEIKDIKKLHFRIESDDPAVQRAVQREMEQLKADYPDWDFTAEFGD